MNMKTLKFQSFGMDKEVYFYLDEYLNGGTYIGAMLIEENGEDYYGNVSVNVPHGYIENKNEFYADTNNSSNLINAMLEAKLIKKMGESVSSGFCVYPKMKITKDFWNYVKQNDEKGGD